ncbi:1-acyl-sn-glycerol-3-phosphate acyltransferase [Treponema sp. OMZ 840]|uniref:lysophospholipid acyltransferase family protein n=1 Tax=Treponema sp. OMZ 840 TaxID=244313 RepID=UPI003D8E8ACC
MPYKKGRPLIDSNLFFRAASALVFYPLMIIAYSIYYVFYRSRIIGRSKLKNCKKAVLVSNHTTFLDPVLMSAAVFPRRSFHTLLESVILVPFLGTLCRLLGGVPVPPSIRSMFNLPKECARGLMWRRFVHFYPEGECYIRNQDVFPFHPGAFLVAAELDIPVVPLATVFVPDKSGTKPRVRLYISDPVHPDLFECKNRDTGKVDLKAVRRFSEHVRNLIQNEINRRGGSRRFYKGAMPRVVGEGS